MGMSYRDGSISPKTKGQRVGRENLEGNSRYHFIQRRLGGLTVVVQSLSCVRLFVTPWTAAHQASLSFTISQSVLKFMSIESVMLSNHLILCCSLLYFAFYLSIESALCIRWPKKWRFSLSNSPPNEYSEWISFRIDWFDFFAVQG